MAITVPVYAEIKWLKMYVTLYLLTKLGSDRQVHYLNWLWLTKMEREFYLNLL